MSFKIGYILGCLFAWRLGRAVRRASRR